MTNDERISGLIEAVNDQVEKRRTLARILRRCEQQFLYYAQNHQAKNTPEATAKAIVNENFARDIREALAEAAPS